jgi:ACS family hexuronate transporter-like MFS transporter
MAHAFAGSVFSFAGCRFLLGIGEAGNFPGSVKAISEWFPPKERAIATGIFNLGAGTGGVIAPPLVGWIIIKFGWQAAFVTTGAVGFLWVILWLVFYYEPESHPRLSAEELTYIRQEPFVTKELALEKGAWRDVLSRREIWPIMVARTLTDPVWIFYLFWLPLYLYRVHGFQLKDIAMFGWMPFLAADVGSVLGGLLSAYLIRRGFSVLAGRKLAMAICASLMPMAIWAGMTSHWQIALMCISMATFGHQSWAANFITLPADVFPKRIVASAYGLQAMCGYLASAALNEGIGYCVGTVGYLPIFLTVAFLHWIATAVLALWLKPQTALE